MSKFQAATLLCGILTVASCANSSLEQIVDAKHAARIDKANENRPLTHGAADGIGFSVAETAPPAISVSVTPVSAPKRTDNP
jgi:hypothetical protein